MRSTRFIFVLLSFLPSAPALASQKSHTIDFSDQVQSIALSENRSHYRVLFQIRAAFYRIEKKKTQAVECLKNSVRRQKPVTVTVDAEKLVILACH